MEKVAGRLQGSQEAREFWMAIDGVVIVDAKDLNAVAISQPGRLRRRAKRAETIVGMDMGVGAECLWALAAVFELGKRCQSGVSRLRQIIRCRWWPCAVLGILGLNWSADRLG